MLEWLQIWVTVQILAWSLLVGKMLFGLCELPQQSKLCVEVSYKRLTLIVRDGYACFQLLDFIELLNPLIWQVLWRFWSFNQHFWQRPLLTGCLPSSCFSFLSFLLRLLFFLQIEILIITFAYFFLRSAIYLEVKPYALLDFRPFDPWGLNYFLIFRLFASFVFAFLACTLDIWQRSWKNIICKRKNMVKLNQKEFKIPGTYHPVQFQVHHC